MVFQMLVRTTDQSYIANSLPSKLTGQTGNNRPLCYYLHARLTSINELVSSLCRLVI